MLKDEYQRAENIPEIMESRDNEISSYINESIGSVLRTQTNSPPGEAC